MEIICYSIFKGNRFRVVASEDLIRNYAPKNQF